jgi:glycerophosphoryl diester phosphodiesterase
MGRVKTGLVVLAMGATIHGGPNPTYEARTFDLQAHRGGRGETTEESLRAFSKALELGVTTLELDVVLTKDHWPLVWHDPRIEPEKCADTGPVFRGDPQYPYVGKRVYDLTLGQIRTLDCGKRLVEFPKAEVIVKNRIAPLSDVFDLADSYGAGVRFNIETKLDAESPAGASASPRELVDVILETIRHAGKRNVVEIESFDVRTLPLVHRAEPSIPLVVLYDDAKHVEDPIGLATSLGASVVSPRYTSVDTAFIDCAHAHGLRVIPWTINDPNAMRAQITAGVDGIITDYPGELRAVMADLGMPLPPPYRR